MDGFAKRVFLSISAVLILLWLALLVWSLRALDPFLASKIIPSSGAGVPPEFPSQPTVVWGPGFSIHRAEPGDTFSGLSERFGLRESALRRVNRSEKGGEPMAGDPVVIPPPSSRFHVLGPGQGLSDVARLYGVPLKGILKANQKRGDSDLRPGEILFIPGEGPDADQGTSPGPRTPDPGQGGFLKPTTGRFADGFGYRTHPITGKKAFHEGLDLAPGWRTRVLSSQSGQVQFAGIRAGYGRLIILDHGEGLASWYAHLDEILVKQGQKVGQGEVIGKVGRSGSATGPHLHFEIRQDGKPRNPLLYLTQ